MDKAELRKIILENVSEYYHVAFGQDEEAFSEGVDPIHYAGRCFDQEELVNLVDSSLDFWLTEGRYSDTFCKELSGFLGLRDITLVNSGSSANLCAFSALTSPSLGERQVKPGDEVIAVACGFPTTVAPAIQHGCIPVFVDVDLGTYNAIPEQVNDAVSDKTKVIFIAHTLGNPFDVEAIRSIADEHNLWLIEDNCDALGSTYDGKLTGTFGDIATVSFYPAHHITTGEGGCVATNNPELGRLVRSFRDWGRDCHCQGGRNNTCGKRFSQQFGTLPHGYDHKYVYSHIGYNLKMTDMQAAIGCAQVKKLPEFVARRRENYRKLYDGLKRYGDRLILFEPTPKSDPSWFAFVLTVREGQSFTRNELTQFLEKHHVETRNLFSGNLLRHPAFATVQHRVVGTLCNADYITENTFFIGVYPGLTDQKIEYMLETFDAFFDIH